MATRIYAPVVDSVENDVEPVIAFQLYSGNSRDFVYANLEGGVEDEYGYGEYKYTHEQVGKLLTVVRRRLREDVKTGNLDVALLANYKDFCRVYRLGGGCSIG